MNEVFLEMVLVLKGRRVIFKAMLDLKVIGICVDEILYNLIGHLRVNQVWAGSSASTG